MRQLHSLAVALLNNSILVVVTKMVIWSQREFDRHTFYCLWIQENIYFPIHWSRITISKLEIRKFYLLLHIEKVHYMISHFHDTASRQNSSIPRKLIKVIGKMTIQISDGIMFFIRWPISSELIDAITHDIYSSSRMKLGWLEPSRWATAFWDASFPSENASEPGTAVWSPGCASSGRGGVHIRIAV